MRAVKATVLVPVTTRSAVAGLAALLDAIVREPCVGEVLICGPTAHAYDGKPKVVPVHTLPGRGAAIKTGIEKATCSVVILQDADPIYEPSEYPKLIAPIEAGQADGVYGVRWHTNGARPALSFTGQLADRALTLFTGAVANLALTDGETGLKAFSTDVLRRITLTADDSGIDAEIAVKVAAQAYRLHEVPVAMRSGPLQTRLSERLSRAATLIKYAIVANDTDNAHEGYNTLLRMEDGAPHYNAWLAKKLRPHLGQRVLEVGAGIGTMTTLIAPGRELVIALEMDRYYVERLRNLFRNKPNVLPVLADAHHVDWPAMRQHRPDSALLSNVLEHIEDDEGVARSICDILPAGGRMVVLVPAIPALFGSMDEAVGHHRRYTRSGIENVLKAAGFSSVTTEWLNFAGIAGWFLNGRVLRRRAVPGLQLRVYDRISPVLARLEDQIRVPVGMSLLAVATR
jgi:SAM-dependent methyltransferase